MEETYTFTTRDKVAFVVVGVAAIYSAAALLKLSRSIARETARYLKEKSNQN